MGRWRFSPTSAQNPHTRRTKIKRQRDRRARARCRISVIKVIPGGDSVFFFFYYLSPFVIVAHLAHCFTVHPTTRVHGLIQLGPSPRKLFANLGQPHDPTIVILMSDQLLVTPTTPRGEQSIPLPPSRQPAVAA